MYNVFTCNVQNGKFMLLIEGDIHFINAKRHPTKAMTSTTWHMCTAVVDVHDKMEAVDSGDVINNHCNVQATTNSPTFKGPKDMKWFVLLIDMREIYMSQVLELAVCMV